MRDDTVRKTSNIQVFEGTLKTLLFTKEANNFFVCLSNFIRLCCVKIISFFVSRPGWFLHVSKCRWFSTAGTGLPAVMVLIDPSYSSHFCGDAINGPCSVTVLPLELFCLVCYHFGPIFHSSALSAFPSWHLDLQARRHLWPQQDTVKTPFFFFSVLTFRTSVEHVVFERKYRRYPFCSVQLLALSVTHLAAAWPETL